MRDSAYHLIRAEKLDLSSEVHVAHKQDDEHKEEKERKNRQNKDKSYKDGLGPVNNKIHPSCRPII